MAQPTATAALNVVQPTCQHLRSKGMYITGQRDLGGQTGANPIGDGHCWCAKTQAALGPDDGLVGRQRCTSARRCYQAVL